MSFRFTPTFWLRTSALITLLFAAGHLAGATNTWSPPGETPVLRSMRSFQFDVMGTSRTYADFYLGFGLYIGILLLLQAVLLWQLGGVARSNRTDARRLVAAVCMASLAGAAVAWLYIFIVPALFASALALCVGLALLSLRQA